MSADTLQHDILDAPYPMDEADIPRRIRVEV